VAAVVPSAGIFDPNIDIGFVSRVPLAPAIRKLARVPIFQITK
jgi:predicted naringenin-chalcone synthase